MNPLPRRLLRNLAAHATVLAARLEDLLNGGCERLSAAKESLKSALGRDIPAAECADMLSQAIAASLPLVAARREVFEVARPWLLEQSSCWEQVVLEKIFSADYSVLCTQSSVLGTPHLYEHFLAEHRRLQRKRGGVFYTPAEMVQFICRRADEQLKAEFDQPAGLAASAILDPAAGSGAFLLGAIEQIHAGFGKSGDWNKFVREQLLPRLLGIEIIPAACLAAKLNIALKLAETGFNFQQPGRIRVELGNTLAGDTSSLQSEIRNLKSPLVILGNPPFSSLSDNRGKWITELVRGSRENPGYVITANEQLREKKTWLHDDYVKFIRYAQWLVEQAASGIVAFVTPHGYLDNVTFRLLRRELLRVFDLVDVIDLHGNRKKGETAPERLPDENVFGLDQGIAIGFLRRLPVRGASNLATFRHAELWGTREEKLSALAARTVDFQTVDFQTVAPQSPNFPFSPSPPPTPPEYAAGWRLPDAMPVNSTAPVTARDHFVVAQTREELCRRIAEFRDLSVSDGEIRSRYFTRTRSAKYQIGDTRSWKLRDARRIIAGEDNWQSFIRRCLYRPFDWRYVFWHPAMIDWPRNGVVSRLQISDSKYQTSESSLVPNPQSEIRNPKSAILLSRRQMLPTQPCSFFWVADTLPLDGVIRSDNRGSESLFPLYLLGEEGAEARANFAPAFIDEFAQRLQLSWLSAGQGDLTSKFGPEDLLAYIYALFHGPTYRERYAAELRSDFPRLLLPGSKALFADFVPRGRRLIGWHTLSAPAPEMNGISGDALRSFRAGGHHVLKESRQNAPQPHDHPLAPYVAATLAEMSAIDVAILRHGGFPAAFAP